jgi:hypothetical protein
MATIRIEYDPELKSYLDEHKDLVKYICGADILLKTITATAIENDPHYCFGAVDNCLYFLNEAKKINNAEIMDEHKKTVIKDYCNKRIKEVNDAKGEIIRRSPKKTITEIIKESKYPGAKS